jgi:hypothetical protein
VARVVLLVVVVVGIVGIMGACGDPKYDESWKPAKDYCYHIEFDPRGDGNRVLGHTENYPVLTVSEGGWEVLGKDVRVDEGDYSRDYVVPYIQWVTGPNGYIRVEGCK